MNESTNIARFIDRFRTHLQTPIAHNDIRSVEVAIGSFFEAILTDPYMQVELGLTEDGWTPEIEHFLYEWMLVFLHEDCHYIYYPPNLISAVRVYYGYHRKDWYGQYYFGVIPATHQNRWRRNFHRARHFQAAPRDHGKSTIYSYELPLWHICYIDNIRILMSSKTDDLANKYLGAIKRTIETNMRLREDFGDLTENINPVDGTKLEGGKGKGGWSKHVLFCRRTNHALKDGTLESVGWGSAITGSRFDLIVLDDPIEEKDCRTKKARALQQENLHVLEELLEPEGQFLVIGTRKHRHDVYGYIFNNPRWTYTIDRGIITYPYTYEYLWGEDEETGKKIIIGVSIPEDATWEVLWEEKWSLEDLLIKKAGSLPSTFEREVQNNIITDELSDFPQEWLKSCEDIKVLGQRHPYLISRPAWAKWIVIGVDLSGIFNKEHAEEQDTDYTVLTVWAIDRQNNRHLIQAFRERGIDVEAQLDQMIAYNVDFQPDFFVVETNAYQKVMEGLALKRKLPVYPHNTGGEKHGVEHGLPRLSLEIKNSYFVWYTGDPQAHQFYLDLFSEFHGYGVDEHDDIVMSTWLADLGINWLIGKEQKRAKRKQRRLGGKVKVAVEKAMETVDTTSIHIEKLGNRPDLEAARNLLQSLLHDAGSSSPDEISS